MNLEQRVWEYCRNRDLLHPGDRVVVGVSGGPDSLCLLDILARLADRHGLALTAAYLNHGLRGEAAAEAGFVQAQAEARSLPFYSETVDTLARALEHKESVEAAARALRYGYFGRVAHAVGAARIAVAHTQDDQAETVLMHLLRGAGLKGLIGMPAGRLLSPAEITPHAADVDAGSLPQGTALQLIRPLLAVTRLEVMAYCAEHGLEPRLDASNLDQGYLRNRVRHSLLPALADYNPNLRAVLARSAEALRGDYELVQDAVQALWMANALPGEVAGEAAFIRDRWGRLSEAQQRALLREAAGRLLGHLTDIDYAPIAAAARFSRTAAAGRSCTVAAGLTLSLETERVVLRAAGPPPHLFEADAPLLQDDGSLAPGWRLETEATAIASWARPDGAGDRWTEYVDAARAAANLLVRARRPGDRFSPLGMNGRSMKISDFMLNVKLPIGLRDRWPLVLVGEEIVWVAGLRLDDRFRVTDASRQIMRLAFVRDALQKEREAGDGGKV